MSNAITIELGADDPLVKKMDKMIKDTQERFYMDNSHLDFCDNCGSYETTRIVQKNVNPPQIIIKCKECDYAETLVKSA